MQCHCSLITCVTYLGLKGPLACYTVNHAQQHILNTFLLLMVDQNINHTALLLHVTMVLSSSPLFIIIS